ncbi:C39 family peptidase [Bacillus sp. CGMCC 1.16607]|uniref:C39 family peptidase n=1 Tax=Bacillus sp. CGMCC 1.16607 TaxID=3351842 RepID=UPI00363424F0
MKKIHFFAAIFPLLVCSHVTAKVSHATIINDYYINGVHSHTENWFTEYLLGQNLPLKDKPVEVISQTKLIDVPLIKQNPELRYGCEVTSLTMVLNYAGVKVNKMELYRKVKKDGDPIIRSQKGDILRWGDPHEGFVGDMTGRNGKAGYAVFDQPIVQLMNEYIPDRVVNLTNQPFDKVLAHVSKGYPVVIWTTGDYRLPDRWESWKHGNHTIKTPLDLHVVVLVGYDSQFVYLNDPLSGRKNVKVNKQQFIQSWKALKSRAVSYE